MEIFTNKHPDPIANSASPLCTLCLTFFTTKGTKNMHQEHKDKNCSVRYLATFGKGEYQHQPKN